MLFLKPCWRGVKILCWSTCCMTWLTMQCSSNLQASQTRDRGQTNTQTVETGPPSCSDHYVIRPR